MEPLCPGSRPLGSWIPPARGTNSTCGPMRWSNGAPVRAQDFVNAWRRVVDPKEGSPVADNLRVIAGAEAIIAGRAIPSSLGVSAPRDDVLAVVLTRPAPYFPQLLTHYSTFPVFSESAAKSHDSKTWVSNGAYVLSSWTPGSTSQRDAAVDAIKRDLSRPKKWGARDDNNSDQDQTSDLDEDDADEDEDDDQAKDPNRADAFE
jgi:ABC-type transport system substrate-binding protein